MTGEHENTCEALRHRANAVREYMVRSGRGHTPMPPAHTSLAVDRARRLAQQDGDSVWEGILIEYTDGGDQLVELCTCGAAHA